MEIRQTSNPIDAKHYDTERLRKEFLIESLMNSGKVTMSYTHYDRMIAGGVMPDDNPVALETLDDLKSDYFLERRELGIINIAGEGTVSVDSRSINLHKLDCLYVSRGAKEVTFSSSSASNPAKFYLISTPAHKEYPTTKMSKEKATVQNLGSGEACNERTIYKYIHPDGISSCQLVMGLTILASGSIWNTMPAHTHDRRMEVYFYYDLAEDARVFHFMGEPSETRHLLIANEQAVISPPWSIHAGAGTTHYSFIWAMAGENQSFADMDFVAINNLK